MSYAQTPITIQNWIEYLRDKLHIKVSEIRNNILIIIPLWGAFYFITLLFIQTCISFVGSVVWILYTSIVGTMALSFLHYVFLIHLYNKGANTAEVRRDEKRFVKFIAYGALADLLIICIALFIISVLWSRFFLLVISWVGLFFTFRYLLIFIGLLACNLLNDYEDQLLRLVLSGTPVSPQQLFTWHQEISLYDLKDCLLITFGAKSLPWQ